MQEQRNKNSFPKKPSSSGCWNPFFCRPQRKNKRYIRVESRGENDSTEMQAFPRSDPKSDMDDFDLFFQCEERSEQIDIFKESTFKDHSDRLQEMQNVLSKKDKFFDKKEFNPQIKNLLKKYREGSIDFSQLVSDVKRQKRLHDEQLKILLYLAVEPLVDYYVTCVYENLISHSPTVAGQLALDILHSLNVGESPQIFIDEATISLKNRTGEKETDDEDKRSLERKRKTEEVSKYRHDILEKHQKFLQLKGEIENLQKRMVKSSVWMSTLQRQKEQKENEPDFKEVHPLQELAYPLKMLFVFRVRQLFELMKLRFFDAESRKHDLAYQEKGFVYQFLEETKDKKDISSNHYHFLPKVYQEIEKHFMSALRSEGSQRVFEIHLPDVFLKLYAHGQQHSNELWLRGFWRRAAKYFDDQIQFFTSRGRDHDEILARDAGWYRTLFDGFLLGNCKTIGEFIRIYKPAFEEEELTEQEQQQVNQFWKFVEKLEEKYLKNRCDESPTPVKLKNKNEEKNREEKKETEEEDNNSEGQQLLVLNK